MRHFAMLLLICVACSAEDPPPPMLADLWDGSGNFPSSAVPPVPQGDMQAKPAWSAPMPGGCRAGMLVVNNMIVVPCEPDTVVAIDATTGRECWQVRVSSVELEKDAEAKQRGHELMTKAMANMANGWTGKEKEKEPNLEANAVATELKSRFRLHCVHQAPYQWYGYLYNPPISDGKRIYVQSSTGALAGVSFEGKIEWMIRRPTERNRWPDMQAQPVCADGMVGVWVTTEAPRGKIHPRFASMADQKAAEFCSRYLNWVLIAFDGATGKEIWRSEQMLNPDHGCWGSSAVGRLSDGTPFAVPPSGAVVSLKDGKILAWSGAGFNDKNANALIRGDRVISGPHVITLRPGTESLGLEPAWPVKVRGSSLNNPGIADGKVFYHRGGGEVLITDLATGAPSGKVKVNWKKEGQKDHPTFTPIGFGKHLYVCRGEVTVLAAAETFKKVGSIRIPGEGVQSLTCIGATLILRTVKAVHAINATSLTAGSDGVSP